MKKIKEFIKNNYQWIILFISLLCFIFIAKDVFNKEITVLDTIGHRVISKLFRFEVSTDIAKFITCLGGATALISIAFMLFVATKNKKIGLSIVANLGIITALNVILKNIVQRARPMEHRIINETGYSFPSGHSMASMAFYGYLIYLSYKYIKNKKLKCTLMTLLGILIISIGTSRIYLGVHYTSDVLAGFLISISYLVLYIKAMYKFILNVDNGKTEKNGEVEINETEKSLKEKFEDDREKMKTNLEEKVAEAEVKVKKITNSFKYAFRGIASSFKSERNMKFHVAIMLIVIAMGILLKITKAEWATCIILFAIVIAGEMFNTAIETIVDMVMPHQNEKAKIAKDISAGAVLILAIGAAIIGIMIFLPRLIEIFLR